MFRKEMLVRNTAMLVVRRGLSRTSVSLTSEVTARFNKPLSPDVLPRPAGICSMMRLPVQETTAGHDACFLGVPLDIGGGYRNTARFGPRFIRMESVNIRPINGATGAAPFESLQVADAGDVRVNQYDLAAACDDVRRHFSKLECVPLAMGGDHTISYPILQALKEKHGPVGLIQLDAHTDTLDMIAGSKLSHSTPFRRALEEDCILPEKTVQIGIRGTAYNKDNFQWGLDQGFRVIRAEECWHKSLSPLMEEVRGIMGDSPVYLTFDIDAIDPAFAPGTGTQEIGGLTSIQALEAVRGCRGLNIIGADLVEVLPAYDVQNMTSLAAAQLLFEMLCVLPGVKYYPV